MDDLAKESALVSFQPILLTSLCHSSLISTQSKGAISKSEVDYEELAVRFLQDMDLTPNAARYVLRYIFIYFSFVILLYKAIHFHRISFIILIAREHLVVNSSFKICSFRDQWGQ